MYGWIWRRLPGPTPIKALEALAIFLAVVAVLFLYVFPWAAPRLPFSDVSLEALGHTAGVDSLEVG